MRLCQPFQLLHIQFFLQLLITFLHLPRVSSKSSLDCNFESKSCCWKNKGNGVPWQTHHGKSRDDDYRTIIRPLYYVNQTTSVTPQQKFSADWISCPLCSKTGLVTVRLRAHQTPTTRIKLCWKPVDDDGNVYRHCTFLRTSRSELTNKHFTVTPNQPIQFYIKLHNNGRHSVATATIDSIAIFTDECDAPTRRPIVKSPKLFSVAGVSENRGTGKAAYQRVVGTKWPTTTPSSNSSFILKDIFGDAFAQFLVDDSDGLISENQKIELTNDMNVNDNGKLNQQDGELSTATAITPRPLLSFNLLECNTAGGCLFDRSVCSYQNSYLSRGSTFQPISVYGRNFMQALTVPNTLAVMETNTLLTEEHKIVFDVLEFTEGERLYGCCYKTDLEPHEALFGIATALGGNRPSDLFCPFATAAHSTPITWRTARFTCPRGTTKILFMCENYGTLNGTCAMDNVRLHKIFDILEVEPCQKDIITSS